MCYLCESQGLVGKRYKETQREIARAKAAWRGKPSMVQAGKHLVKAPSSWGNQHDYTKASEKPRLPPRSEFLPCGPGCLCDGVGVSLVARKTSHLNLRSITWEYR